MRLKIVECVGDACDRSRMAADADCGRGWKRVCFVRSRRRGARVLPCDYGP